MEKIVEKSKDLFPSIIIGLGFAMGVTGAVILNNYFKNPEGTGLPILVAGILLLIVGLGIVGNFGSELFE